MWQAVEQQLIEALTARLYLSLFSDRYYRDFLLKAGLSTSADPTLKGITDAQRRTLVQQATITARIIVGSVRDSGGLSERNVRFELLKGPLSLYRAGTSNRNDSKLGPWWFSADVWKLCKAQAGPKDERRIEWLHTNLAVCYDWSQCDQLYELELDSSDEVLAIRADGSAMTVFGSPRMARKTLPGMQVQATIVGGLRGGLLQTVLPYFPESKVHGALRLAGEVREGAVRELRGECGDVMV